MKRITLPLASCTSLSTCAPSSRYVIVPPNLDSCAVQLHLLPTLYLLKLESSTRGTHQRAPAYTRVASCAVVYIHILRVCCWNEAENFIAELQNSFTWPIGYNKTPLTNVLTNLDQAVLELALQLCASDEHAHVQRHNSAVLQHLLASTG